MEELNIELVGQNEQIVFVHTYGIHKELQEYLFTDNHLVDLLTNTEVAKDVITICLSSRNAMGRITREFAAVGLIKAEAMIYLLESIFEFYTNFFLNNQEKVENLVARLNLQEELKNQSQSQSQS